MNSSFLRTFKFFFKLYKKQTVTVVALLIFSGLAEAVGVAGFFPLLQIILSDSGTLSSDPISKFILHLGFKPDFVSIALLMMLAMITKALFLWIAMRYVSGTVSKVAGDLRMRLMKGLLHANWRYFVTHTLGSSLNAIATETFQASMAFMSATRFMAACVQFLVYATGAFFVSWFVFTGGVVIGGLIVLGLWGLVKMARRAGNNQTAIAKEMLVQLTDMLQGIKPLRAMALEDKFLDIMKSQSKGLQKAQSEQLVSAQSMRIFNEPLMMIAGVSGLYLAVTYGELNGSELILIGVLFMRILTGMNLAQGEYQRLATQESALLSLMETIHEAENSVQKWPGKKSLAPDANNITFQNVSFGYTKEKTVLKNVSLTFPSNKLIAIVGSSGSGKTSILDLLCGFYTPADGVIEVSGTSIKDLDLYEWRKALGFVPQEVFLFNDTVFENIRIGRNVSEDEVWGALDAAGARDFVSNMPEGLNSNVGENGRKLSGGQRQRIAIARAIIGRPRFLLLDEATSALDSQTEKNLLETLKALSKEITIIFVSHNKAVLSYADIVYEIGRDQIIERDA